jgi:hypothetical protein
VENSVAIIAAPVLIDLAFLLLQHRWPLVASIPVTSPFVQNKHKVSFSDSAFGFPSSEYLDIREHYFRLAFFTKVIRTEKRRI